MTVTAKTYSQVKEATIKGRYVVNEQINMFLEPLYHFHCVETEGFSVQKRPVQSITLGSGPKKVLMWSQMHGNESTTTKAVLDMINLLNSANPLANAILNNCTLKILPMLNPDGAAAYTRVNANQVDLNRDAKDRSQPESNVLRDVYDDFRPDFCFNLHDQRTIFNVGNTEKPATVSFLAPAHDEERNISATRATSMKLIVAMNVVLQAMIPEQVGRYDDAFNANCVGDTFQMLRTPTILFEAGHFSEDYPREKTREYIFYALITALDCIGQDKIEAYRTDDYFDIPENQKLFFDILVKNLPVSNSSETKDVGILYHEVLKERKVIFEPKIDKEGDLRDYFGHRTYDCLDPKDLEGLKNTDFWNLLKR